MTLKIGSLCSGYGGLDMAVMDVLDAEVAWHCQYEPPDKDGKEQPQHAAQILEHHWPEVSNHGDITKVDWDHVEPVDVLTAGFPCQDVSVAGRRAGLAAGTRSGLWRHVATAVNELRPSMVVIENVPGILSSRADGDVEPCPWCLGDPEGEPHLRALGAVLSDLAGLGFDAEWLSLDASDVGAAHKRRRVFVLAWPVADTEGDRWDEGRTQSARLVGGSDVAEHGGAVAADSPDDGFERGGRSRHRGHGSADGREPTADSNGRRFSWQPECDGEPDRSETNHVHHEHGADGHGVEWGAFAPAIIRWERVLGRIAPAPTEPNRDGRPRLSAHAVEFLMGLPAGHVIGVPGIPRSGQLKALGNGVVPQQAAMALRVLLERAGW